MDKTLAESVADLDLAIRNVTISIVGELIRLQSYFITKLSQNKVQFWMIDQRQTLRWIVAELADRDPRHCWADLCLWAIDPDREIDDLPEPSAGYCARYNQPPYCGKCEDTTGLVECWGRSDDPVDICAMCNCGSDDNAKTPISL